MRKYRYLVLGGTFDHLHLGHQKFLDQAFSLADKVDIGLVNNSRWLAKKKLQSEIESYSQRKSRLIQYLKLKQYFQRAKIIPLKDIYGSTLVEKKLQAILITQYTRKNAILINALREKKEMEKLDIIEVKTQNDKNEQTISSERIRLGEINRDGFIYFDLFNKARLKLPKKLRPTLRQPLGKIYSLLPAFNNNKSQNIVVTVGDIISQSFMERNLIPDIRVIDYRSRRKPLTGEGNNQCRIINQAGTINQQAVFSLKYAIQNQLEKRNKTLIEIKGEEDLLVLPAVLLLPLGARVYYGQLNIGLVEIEVTEATKEKVRKILELFI